MREDDDQFRQFVPLLRRIIILVAVITAVPVILWTITAFVRSYVGPPKIPTFHHLGATASAESAASTRSDASGPPLVIVDQAKLSDTASTTIEATATTTDASNPSPAPKGPYLGDRAPEGTANTPVSAPMNTPTSAPKMAAMPAAAPATAKTAQIVSAAPAAMAPPATATAPAAAAAEPMAPAVVAAQQPAAASEPGANNMPAAAPLSGPIPLPRHRPRDLGMTKMTHMAEMAPPTGSIPMPRPRPDAAGPGAPPETTSAGPLDFLQNLFGNK